MLLGLLLTLNIMICLALIGVVLLQRSEGGALGGGSPTGLITTRGAGDLLTRTTWVLFTLFLSISLALTLLGGHERSSQAILDRLKLQTINPDSLPAPTRAPTPNSAAGSPAPLLAPTPLGAAPVATAAPTAAMAPARAPRLSAPVPKVRIPAASNAATSPGSAESNTMPAPSPTAIAPAHPAPTAAPTAAPNVPKLITPTPAPLSIPPPTAAKPAGGDAPVNTGPQ